MVAHVDVLSWRRKCLFVEYRADSDPEGASYDMEDIKKEFIEYVAGLGGDLGYVAQLLLKTEEYVRRSWP